MFTQALPAARDPLLAGFFMPVFCGRSTVEMETTMLLLNRRCNESITTWTTGRRDAPLRILVAEVSPNGTVTLGFEGDTHEVCRTEIFHNYGDEKNGYERSSVT